jgi:hypothetical protein
VDIFNPQTWLGVLLAAGVICLPGGAIYLLAVRLLSKERGQLGAALLLGIGLSVAFWPLLLLYLSLVGLRFSPLLLWSVLVLSLGLLVLLFVLSEHRPPTRVGLIVGLTLLGLTLIALVFRSGDIAGLAVPMFGDSLHHTMIATIIADTGRVPGGYQPYVSVDSFTYHFGFHTLVAVLSQLSGFSVPVSVLLVGQVLIAASLPVSYVLARGLLSSPLAGLGAALITGFVSVMPGYYVNFGRYTQLSGQILLPVALVLLARTLRQDYRRRDGILLGLCVAGLVVVHYRILIFFGLFALPLAAWHIFTLRSSRREILQAWSRVALAVAGALLATSPWIWNLLSDYIPGLVSRLSSVSAEYIAGYNSLENLRRYVGLTVAALGLLGLGIALARVLMRGTNREQAAVQEGKDEPLAVELSPQAGALVLASWAALTIVSIWFPPGAIGSYTVALSLYLPLSALGGYGLAYLLSAAAQLLRLQPIRLAPLLLVSAPLLALSTGTWHMIDIATFSYVREADLRAFEWARANTADGSKFLISSEISYAGRGVTASDAGMWLPLLAGRNVSVPALASWTEHPIESDFFVKSRELAALTQPPNDPAVQALVNAGSIPPPRGLTNPETLSLMQELGITHVYSGTPGGASKLRLDLAAMRGDSCHYRLVYPPERGVYIFEVSYTSCR